MYSFAQQAEVLGKRVVVQHIPLGGLLEWDPSPAQASTIFSTLQKTAAYSPTTIVMPPRNFDSPMGIGNTPSTNMAGTGGTQAPWAKTAFRTGTSDHETSLASMMQPPGSIYRYGSDHGDWASNASKVVLDGQYIGMGVNQVPTGAPWANASVGSSTPPVLPFNRRLGGGKRGGGSRSPAARVSSSVVPPPTSAPREEGDPGTGQPSGHA